MRVGIVGAGTMGRVHAAAYRRIGVEGLAAYDVDPVKLADFAAEEGTEPFTDYPKMLAEVDVVDVCAPTFAHQQLAEQAFAAGRDVILEKPLALSVAQGEQILRAARESGRRLFVAMVVRFFPQYRRARELVSRGELGRIGVVRLKRVSFPPAAAWFRDPAKSGGMPVDLMIHDLDYARWLLGGPRRVFARMSRGDRASALEHVQATLAYDDGAMVFVEGGWAYPPGYFRTSLDIAGDKGLIEWSSDQPVPLDTLLPKDAPPPKLGLPMAGLEENPYETELRHALSAFDSGEPFAVAPQEALEALRLAIAVRESALSESVVEVA